MGFKLSVLPTWVNRYTEGGVSKFQILAMDGDEENWKTQMNLTDDLLAKCKESFDRTTKIVGAGLDVANQYFTQNQAEIEEQIGVIK